jgi:hypothetical protein
MADMNAVPLGFEQSDSVGGTENQADDVQFDFVLENFTSLSAGVAKRSPRVQKAISPELLDIPRSWLIE